MPHPKFARRVMVIGLDCAAPELVFERFAGRLPNLDALRARGEWGRLESVVPPITVPAWACMMTGCDPGRLGIYGFRNRTGHGYNDWGLADSTWVREPAVWDHLGAAGGKSVLIGVPPSYPVSPINGLRIGCFLTPDTNSGTVWTYPEDLGDKLRFILNRQFPVDVSDFRTNDKHALLERIFQQSEEQFDMANFLARYAAEEMPHSPIPSSNLRAAIGPRPSRDWTFFMLVNIALDRLHHGFWAEFDPYHRRYNTDSPFREVALRFYQHLDTHIGELLEVLTPEDAVLVVSDHGAKAIDGGIAINEWLIERGYLVLHERPTQPTPLAKLSVDWPRTKAWSEGGYYARVFINRQGREPQGCVRPEEYEEFRRRLADEIRSIPDDAGRPLPTRVYTPEELYREANGFPPDLLVLFGDLAWRSIGTVGHGKIHVLENDTGPDDANHAQHGMYILAGPGIAPAANKERKLVEIGPMLLALLGLKP